VDDYLLGHADSGSDHGLIEGSCAELGSLHAVSAHRLKRTANEDRTFSLDVIQAMRPWKLVSYANYMSLNEFESDTSI
jgi:hypothetical protein